MAEKRDIEGQCLCGAVSVSATVEDPKLTACHCDMCRQHSGGVFTSIMTDQSTNKVDGPFKIFRSSEWAERGFCSECGSTLWYGTVHDGARYLAAGLFENAGGATLDVEYFVDKCPEGYALAGKHSKLTTQQTIELFTDETADGQPND